MTKNCSRVVDAAISPSMLAAWSFYVNHQPSSRSLRGYRRVSEHYGFSLPAADDGRVERARRDYFRSGRVKVCPHGAHNGRMGPGLHAVAAALAKLDDAELRVLIASGDCAPEVTPALLAWLEHAAHWELHRRAGSDFPLQSPDTAIDASEYAASIGAAMILREQFAKDSRAVAALFDEIVKLLTDGERKH